MLQLRPDARSGKAPEARFYCPDRDLAYITPKLLSAAFHMLDQSPSPLDKEMMAQVDTEKLLGVASSVGAFVKGVYEQDDFKSLLASSGLTRCHPQTLGVLGFAILLLVLSAHHSGVLQNTQHGCEAPPEVDQCIADIESRIAIWARMREPWWHRCLRWLRLAR